MRKLEALCYVVLIAALTIFVASICFAVPAPKPQPIPPERTIVGVWELRWGTIIQYPSFAEDGSHDDPQFGPGPWESESLGGGMVLVRFSERGNLYAAKFDTTTGIGWGCRLSQVEGEWVYDWTTNVRFTRFERLPIGPIE